MITLAFYNLEELVNHLVNFIFILICLFNPAPYTAKMIIIITSHATPNLACIIHLLLNKYLEDPKLYLFSDVY